MKLLATTALSLSLIVSAFAQSNRTGGVSGADAGVPPRAQNPQTIKIIRAGSQRSRLALAEHFTGSARIDPLFSLPSHALSGAHVTFESGARTAWHSHPLGQILIVTAGKGWVRQWGGPVEEVRQGDVVWIPPNVKNWHGATASTSVTCIAIQEGLNGKSVKWMEKVSDEQYGSARSVSDGATNMTKKPSAAQKLFGDIDPKLAEITDNVLFGDVWKRPGLSQHDRSLITVAALIALNRPEQLRAHIRLAREHGVTKDEIVETITQLAFYAGWPNAVNAINVAREVFEKK